MTPEFLKEVLLERKNRTASISEISISFQRRLTTGSSTALGLNCTKSTW
ncbi:MAG: hypothetical protein WAW07_11590 [Bacteroidales bacterium]